MDNLAAAPEPVETVDRTVPAGIVTPAKKGGKGAVVLAILFALIAVGLGVWLAIVLLNPPKKDNCEVSNNENSNQATENGNNDSSEKTAKRLYTDARGFSDTGRYLFASDESIQADDLTTRSFLDKKFYLVDFAKYGTDGMVSEYDLKSLIEPKFNEWKAKFPDTLKIHDEADQKKSDVLFIVTYSGYYNNGLEEYADDDRYVPLVLSYSLGWKTNGSSKYGAEGCSENGPGCGDYLVYIDVLNHKLAYYSKIDY